MAMNSASSWQNSISLCPASFCMPKPNLPITPRVSRLPSFAFQSPIMKRMSFWGFSSKRSCRFHRTIQLQLLQCYWLGHRLGLPSGPSFTLFHESAYSKSWSSKVLPCPQGAQELGILLSPGLWSALVKWTQGRCVQTPGDVGNTLSSEIGVCVVTSILIILEELEAYRLRVFYLQSATAWIHLSPGEWGLGSLGILHTVLHGLDAILPEKSQFSGQDHKGYG